MASPSCTLLAASVTLLLGALVLTACTLPEGREPGECSDRADNDADGLYDCDDPDCLGAPDCNEPQDSGASGGTGGAGLCLGYEYTDFLEDYARAVCGKFDDCGYLNDYFSMEDCLAALRSSGDCGDFDCDAARTCVEDILTVSCDDLAQGHGFDACARVCS